MSQSFNYLRNNLDLLPKAVVVPKYVLHTYMYICKFVGYGFVATTSEHESLGELESSFTF